MSSPVILKMNLPGFLTVIAWKSSQAQPKDISHDTDSLYLKLHTQELTHTGIPTSTNAHTSSHAPSISLILCLFLALSFTHTHKHTQRHRYTHTHTVNQNAK